MTENYRGVTARTRAAPAFYDEQTVSQVAEILKALPTKEKHKPGLSRLDAVKRLRPEIKDLKRRGYSTEEIANILCDNGLTISKSTLMNYLQVDRTESTKGGKPARATRSKRV
jgi:IS30 family transposase